MDRAKQYQSNEFTQECRGNTMGEIEAGRASQLMPIDEHVLRTTPLTPRFAVDDAKGGPKRKVSLIDDFRAIGVNDLAHTQDTDAPGNLNTLLAAANFLKKLNPDARLSAFSVDFEHAYKNIPLRRLQGGFAKTAATPPEGEPLMAELRTQPFGARRAPANWGRATAFIQWVLATFCYVYLGKYVDDCFTAEPAGACRSAFDTVKEVCVLLGFPLEDKKEWAPAAVINLLGASVTLGHEFLEAIAPADRKHALLVELKAVLSSGKLTPSGEAKIRGRLGYGQSLMFWRMGRAHLAPFPERQYEKFTKGAWKLSTSLREVIAWWIANISSSVPRRISPRRLHPLILYADAAGSG